MADLKFIGRILGVIGGILLVIFGIIMAINGLLPDLNLSLNIGGIDFGTNIIGGLLDLGDLQWLFLAAIMIICGLVAIYGYKELASKGKGDLLIWGIIYIVVGIVGLGLGGLLVFIGGIVLLIDNFI
ncbi:MAG: hypothetical protein KAT16_05330 [Candidatus Heimdallarchaeota archaeon]|nr:hypothetical protein [Candidatus Heimdallarchaeota archaeon]